METAKSSLLLLSAHLISPHLTHDSVFVKTFLLSSHGIVGQSWVADVHLPSECLILSDEGVLDVLYHIYFENQFFFGSVSYLIVSPGNWQVKRRRRRIKRIGAELNVTSPHKVRKLPFNLIKSNHIAYKRTGRINAKKAFI